MSDPLPTSLGSFAFVPWLRRGAARYIGAGASAQAPVSVSLQIGTNTVTSPALALRGPGDIIGFDPAGVCRIWPANAATDAEPEFLALIEFDQPDLPWRYTPAAPAGDLLSPWLCLIVATDGEYSSLVPGTADRPLGSVTITSSAALPDLSQSFAWAHTEAIGETTLDGPLAASLAQSSPQLVRSRILCPRTLAANTAYMAFLVPTTELGRLSGLMTPAANIPATVLPWGTPPVTLPVYYQWAFSTGDAGDFSILVRQLSANPLPDSVAWRDMDVGDVSGGVAPIGMESALTTAEHPSEDLPAADQVRLAARYASALASTPPAVRPPLYGRAYVPISLPPWYADLNNDPRTRAAAGLGAQVVRQHADALLAGAWSQAEGLREANQELKQWELSRELARSLWSRHAPTNSADAFLSFMAPIATRVRNGAVTVAHSVTVSTLAPGSLSAALRRISRPSGAVALRQQRQAAPALMSRMSSGAWLGSASLLAPATSTTRGLNSVRIASTASSTQRLGNVATLFGAGDPVTALKATNDTTGLAAAATTLLQQLAAAPEPGLVLTALNLPVFQKAVAGEVDPAAAIDVEVHSRTVRSDGLGGAAPFVVAPSFRQAMSQWLAALSQEWLLAGLGEVPADTVSLLAGNQRFLEAFMAGLNDEMGRRLIFDEYPTDVRATFFKSFWQDGVEDIASLDTWGAFGSNPSPSGFGGDPLVLLIRGAIVRRYPNMQVFAVQATQAVPQRSLGGTETPILFSGRMDPDVAFYGFPLTKEQALGTSTTPGYYFVIQEHPCEPHFGGTIPAGSSAAAAAAALLRRPVRLAIYAADLLSADTSGGP